jgi:hypothetical protein
MVVELALAELEFLLVQAGEAEAQINLVVPTVELAKVD